MNKTHWSHADSFRGDSDERIRAFIHKDYEIGFHTHSFYELNIVISGTGEHLIEQMKCNVYRGCVFVIPPNVRHSYKNLGGLNVYHILIHRDFLSSCFSEFLKTVGFSLLFEIEPYVRAKYRENMFLILNEEKLGAVLTDLEQLHSCKGLHGESLYVNAIAKKILVFLCMEITRQIGVGEMQPQSKKELFSIADSINFIHLNYEEKITVDQLAKRQNMSRATYIRSFTKICGCSPHRYLMKYRMQKAYEKLADGHSSVTDIAQSCGFYDASHLRKYLKKE